MLAPLGAPVIQAVVDVASVSRPPGFQAVAESTGRGFMATVATLILDRIPTAARLYVFPDQLSLHLCLRSRPLTNLASAPQMCCRSRAV